MSKRTKESTKKLNSLLLIILLTAILMIASTYAWFSTQKDVTLSNLKGKVEIAEGLEGSIDGKTWGNTIDLTSLTDSKDGKTIIPKELLPVSGAGEVVGSTGIDLYKGNLKNHKSLENITLTLESKHEQLPAELTSPSYVAFDLYLKDTKRGEGPTSVLQLNTNSTCTATQGTKSGLHNAMRVGLASFTTGVDVLANETEVTTGQYGAVKDIAIWEPNANQHIQYIVDNNQLPEDVKQSFGLSSVIPSYAVKKGNNGTINDVFTLDSTSNIKQNALQTNGIFGDQVYNLKSAKDGTTDFTILANKISKVRVYLWLEGSDVDCANVASHGGEVNVELGLIKDVAEVANPTV